MATKKKQPAATETSESIEKQMQEFLARGGQIDKIESGVKWSITAYRLSSYLSLETVKAKRNKKVFKTLLSILSVNLLF